jgi:hypothetical protein
VLDESGAASPSPQIVVAAQGTDTIDGAPSAVIHSAYGSLELVTNGVGNWFKLQDAIASIGNLAQLGINAPTDPANPLSATLNAALLNALSTTYGGSGDVRLKLTKQASTNTASIQFQDNFSGRAEIGLTGDDNFHLKVSSNGSTWIDALDISGTSGVVSATMGFSGSPDPTYLRGFLAGLILSNDATTPNTVLDISAGVANADDSSFLMKLTSAITKTTGAWAVGSGNGALDTGAVVASTWYHVYVIARTDTGVIDALLSTSATAPTMPAGYTKKRRVGAIRTDASAHVLAFSQNGDEFLWATPSTDISAATVGISPTLYSLSVPSGVKVNALYRGYFSNTTTGNFVLINSPDETATNANTPNGNLTQNIPSSSSVLGVGASNTRTNIAAQVRISSAANTGISLTLATYGWIDPRGRLA